MGQVRFICRLRDERQEIGYSRSKQTGFIKSESARSIHTSSARSPQTSHTWEGDPETEIHFPSGTLELALNWFRWPGIGPLPSFWIGQLNEEDDDRPTAPSRTLGLTLGKPGQVGLKGALPPLPLCFRGSREGRARLSRI